MADHIRHLAQGIRLSAEQPLNAALRQAEHLRQVPKRKGFGFPRALQFNEPVLLIHHDVHIRSRDAVFPVAQIKHRDIRDDAAADRRHLVPDGRLL
ncbi:hypothetical protein SDC9_114250 [bioreactor metagenome]|uniref:Uncharacterized protein n=1 Tax=bioreactor metagenome TaxID=1076179 RepID=A0A645BQE5_9ZZZZ